MKATYVILIGGALLAGAWLASAQQTYSGPIRYGTSAGVCSYLGELWIDTSATPTLKTCTQVSPVAWTVVGGGGSGSAALPAGAMVLVDTGVCPAGFAEASDLDGRFLVGTVAAHGNVGTTGGSDVVTPAGTLSAPMLTMDAYTPQGTVSAPTFTGQALATHLHGFGTLAVAAHTIVATKQGTAAGNVVTTATHTVSGSTAAISAGTPSGTVSAPTFTGTTATLTGTVSTPTFTGTALDARPAFTRVIACRKT